ncbi:hypothetical protein FIBSPDRAFT_1046661 [Athelia psychrophila]|uniref:DUF7918 domain-containing protein n=1 Tax=Athelia psychrophila TaxID=1759441 RepID=A0A166GAR1_9AGAM|nr:hypothetical protein FIBSPDRAFT_1046661 [Fibularhizoctonia sp. CBS 109695]
MPLELSDFSAWIECGGSELECYAIEYSDDRATATCWIASEIGKQFDVLWSRDSESKSHTEDMCGLLFIDDVRCAGKPMRAESKKCRWYSGGIRTSPSTIRPYAFGSMQLTGMFTQIQLSDCVLTFNIPDEDALMDTQCSTNLGNIVLEIWRVTMSRESQAARFGEDPLGEPKIHEQTKKAVDHKVKLGEEIFTGPKRLTTRSGTCDQKLIEFTFKYRPIDVLIANDIAPRAEMHLGLAPGLENGQASPGQIPEYDNAPWPVSIKQELQEDIRDAAAATDIQAVPVKVEPPLQVAVAPMIMDSDNDGSEDEDADAVRMRALKVRRRVLEEEFRELEKKAEIKALKKRLAELEGNGAPSGSGPQGPAKRAKRAQPVSGSTRGSSRRAKREPSIIDLT